MVNFFQVIEAFTDFTGNSVLIMKKSVKSVNASNYEKISHATKKKKEQVDESRD